MENDFQALLTKNPPRCHVFDGEIDLFMNRFVPCSKSGFVFTFEGSNMKLKENFYDELERVLKFPNYFGRNLDALEECLTEMEWLSVNGPILLIIRDAEMILSEEPKSSFNDFVSVLSYVGKEWSIPVEEGEEWDRPAYPFNVVFQAEGDSLVQLKAKLNACPESIGFIQGNKP